MPKLGGRRRAGGTEAASFLGCPSTAEVPLLNPLCTVVGNGDLGTCTRLQFSMCCGGQPPGAQTPGTWRQAPTIRRLLMLGSLYRCVLPTTGSGGITGHSRRHGQIRSHGPGIAKLAPRPGAIPHPCVSWPLNIEESFLPLHKMICKTGVRRQGIPLICCMRVHRQRTLPPFAGDPQPAATAVVCACPDCALVHRPHLRPCHRHAHLLLQLGACFRV